MRATVLCIFTLFLSLDCFGFQQANFSAFVYHRFGDDRFPSTSISEENFERHLSYLKNNGFEATTLSQALLKLKRKKKRLKDIAVITVDDAYKSFYEKAWPLLKKYNQKATLYVNTETVGAPDYMTWEEINEVSAYGIEIGNHSHTHSYFLNEKDIQFFSSDLKTSNKAFLKHMGTIPKTYAYPYGEWNDQMVHVLDTTGYASAVAQNSGVIYVDSPKLHLPRFPMSDTFAEINEFRQKLNVKAIEVTQTTMVDSGYLGSQTKPRLLVNFKEGNFDLSQIQCFIQGSSARKSIRIEQDDLVELSVWPKTELTKRRTLFTITVPDSNGIWHWYSYLWVIPDIKN